MERRLLVITQKVDREDDVLGFFHHWLEKLAQKLDFINVLCLWRGQFSLPSNIKVWSLGKEKRSKSVLKLKELFRFYWYIWRLRKEYDAVFVHMNPIYVFLGGFLWKHWQKKIFLWHNHQNGTWLTKRAMKRADQVFYTSPFSFAASFPKARKMPAGIDTNIFKKDKTVEKIKNSLLYLGRLEPIKRIDVLIEAVILLDKHGRDFVLNIVGGFKREQGIF